MDGEDNLARRSGARRADEGRRSTVGLERLHATDLRRPSHLFARRLHVSVAARFRNHRTTAGRRLLAGRLRFADWSRATRSDLGLVHLRRATLGLPVRAENTHPFTDGRLAFAHNGSISPPPALDVLLSPTTRDWFRSSGAQ